MDAPKLDYRRLIALVREKRDIYDSSMPDYRNRDRINLLWGEIANELRTNVMEVKAKWQMLRCNYMREKKKVQKRMSEGCNATSPTTWCYYYMLTFLDTCREEFSRDVHYDNMIETNNFSNSRESAALNTNVHVKQEYLESDAYDNVADDITDNVTAEDRNSPEAMLLTWESTTSDKNKDSGCNVDIGSPHITFENLENDRSSSISECSRLTENVNVETSEKQSQKRKSSSEDQNVSKAAKVSSSDQNNCQKDNFVPSSSISTDSDQQFFNSLLPFVRNLSSIQNLEFRFLVINSLLKVSNK